MQTDLNKLKEMFGKMELAGFDVKNYLKWGFYFFDYKKNNLVQLSKKLEQIGYVFENIVLMDDNMWRLFVSSINVLSPEELHAKNIAFNELAASNKVELYDGWDVEKVLL